MQYTMKKIDYSYILCHMFWKNNKQTNWMYRINENVALKKIFYVLNVLNIKKASEISMYMSDNQWNVLCFVQI